MNDKAEEQISGGNDTPADADAVSTIAGDDNPHSSAPRRRSPASDSQASTLAGDPSLDETLPFSEEPLEGELNPGDILGDHYRVDRRIGRGAMGAVYVVEHLGLGKRFAAKVVSAARASDKNAIRRLRTEARTLSAIEHENIVNVTHLGQTEDGRLFVVMELLEGEDLGSRIHRQRDLAARGEADPWLPDEEVADYVPQLLSALTAAHQAQVVHRDLKPDNLFLAKKRGKTVLKVVDFGISKMQRMEDQPSLTQTGQILGTPLYMAPEQGKSTAEVDARADLYSFGCILHELLTGQPPFVADGVYDCIVKHATETPRPPSALRPGLSNELDELVLRCLQKKPGNRFANAEAIAEAFALAWAHGVMEVEVSGERPKLSPRPASAETTADAVPVEGAQAEARALLATTGGMEAIPAASPPGGRGRLVVGAAALALLAVGAFAWWSPGADDAPPQPPRAHSAAPAVETQASPTEPSGAEDPAGEATPEPAETPPTSDVTEGEPQGTETPEVAQPVDVHLESTPSGAVVYRMGERLGRTPLDVSVLPEHPTDVELALPGYRRQRVFLNADTPSPEPVRLRHIPRRHAPELAPR